MMAKRLRSTLSDLDLVTPLFEDAVEEEESPQES
jgi:hypothetical protein